MLKVAETEDLEVLGNTTKVNPAKKEKIKTLETSTEKEAMMMVP